MRAARGQHPRPVQSRGPGPLHAKRATIGWHHGAAEPARPVVLEQLAVLLRRIDRNWELLAPFAEARVTVPARYVAGDRDLVVRFPGMDQIIPNLSRYVPALRKTIMLPGCEHWTQQERPAEVNRAILEFLEGVARP